ncbi:MAG: hypothetical protein Q4G68_12060 [Planctomycetia bacterium]|nr:hypothetical protein [Planctomycetia bacterium]
MKSSVKRERSKNDLEAWIVNKYNWCKENQDKVSQFILLCLILCFVFVGVRWYMGRNNSALQNQMDDAYYLSTSRTLLTGGAAPDPVPFEQMATTCKRGEEGLVVRISSAEAYLKTGRSEVEQKFAAANGGAQATVRTPVQPEAAFSKALDRFTEVAQASRDAGGLKARALYGSGVTMEYMASIAENADAVAKNIEKAVAYYESAASGFASSPYAEAAKSRIEHLKQPITLAYYQQLSDKYVNMPKEPVKTDSILPTGTDAPVTPADDTSATSEFKLDDGEAAPVEEAAPAEQAAPAEEAAQENVRPEAK